MTVSSRALYSVVSLSCGTVIRRSSDHPLEAPPPPSTPPPTQAQHLGCLIGVRRLYAIDSSLYNNWDIGTETKITYQYHTPVAPAG